MQFYRGHQWHSEANEDQIRATDSRQTDAIGLPWQRIQETEAEADSNRMLNPMPTLRRWSLTELFRIVHFIRVGNRVLHRIRQVSFLSLLASTSSEITFLTGRRLNWTFATIPCVLNRELDPPEITLLLEERVCYFTCYENGVHYVLFYSVL